MNLVVSVGGVDITADCLFGQTTFTTLTNGNPGACEIVVRAFAVRSWTIGARITCDVDGLRIFDGYLQSVTYRYPLPADKRESSSGRLYVLRGVDVNVLFQKRYVYNKAAPTKMDGPLFNENTADTVAIAELQNWLDLSGDNLTFDVTNVATINLDQKARPFGPSQTFGEAMAQISALTGAVWYIDATRTLRYKDVDVEDAPFELSDMPTGSQVGYADAEIVSDGTALINDQLAWGVGGGSPTPVFSRASDATSISTHGRWQAGALYPGVWKQDTIDRIASSIVYGSPSNKRGHKDDRLFVTCTVYRSGLRAGMKVRFIANAFGIDEVIPIRKMVATLVAPDMVRYDLTLSHEIDGPWASIDPIAIGLGPYRPPRLRIPFFGGLPWLRPAEPVPFTYVIDDFNRGPEMEEPYQGRSWRWSAAFQKVGAVFGNTGLELDPGANPVYLTDDQSPVAGSGETWSSLPAGVWDTGTWYRGWHVYLGGPTTIYELYLSGMSSGKVVINGVEYDVGTWPTNNEPRTWELPFGGLTVTGPHMVFDPPIVASVITLKDQWSQTGLAYRGPFSCMEVLVRSAGSVAGWGTATIGSKWEHIDIGNLSWASHPADDKLQLPRAAQLTDWNVGHVRLDGAGQMRSRLQIPPLGSNTTRFVLRCKFWELNPPGGHPHDNATILRLQNTFAFASPYAEVGTANKNQALYVAMSDGATSSSSPWTGLSIAEATWYTMEMDGNITTNTLTGRVYDSSESVIAQVSWSTPAGALAGLRSGSTLFLEVRHTRGALAGVQELAVDDITMSEYIGDGDYPNLGHVCQTFRGPGPTYTLASSFAPGSAEVWVNGMYQFDYTENPSGGTVTLGFTPDANDWVRICYLAMPPLDTGYTPTWGYGPKLV